MGLANTVARGRLLTDKVHCQAESKLAHLRRWQGQAMAPVSLYLEEGAT